MAGPPPLPLNGGNKTVNLGDKLAALLAKAASVYVSAWAGQPKRAKKTKNMAAGVSFQQQQCKYRLKFLFYMKSLPNVGAAISIGHCVFYLESASCPFGGGGHSDGGS